MNEEDYKTLQFENDSLKLQVAELQKRTPAKPVQSNKYAGYGWLTTAFLLIILGILYISLVLWLAFSFFV